MNRMEFFYRAMKRGANLAALLLLMTGSAWAGDFSDKVERMFSPAVLQSIKDSGSSGEVTFKAPERIPDYFDTGDKANKIFAIESARIFRDVEGLERLKLKAPKDGEMYILDISRTEIERHYGVKLADMRTDPNLWRSNFIPNHDNNKSRAVFFEKFVTKD